jgi:tRNA nucleotidyltransferase/poly(A) polymerase
MSELERLVDQPLFRRIVELLPEKPEVYLVGGAVRDAFIGRSNFDLDFVTGPEAMKVARQLADSLGAAYFPLDPERKVARIVLKKGDRYGLTGENPIKVDVSAYQGNDLDSDLRGRDFTINAMAVAIHHPDKLVDPLRGAADLAARRLRACSSSSFFDDPIRIMRAVRLSVDLDLKIVPDTLRSMRESAKMLGRISAERIRDELFRILTNRHPASSLRLLDNLQVLGTILPELVSLKSVRQSPPHLWDVFEHTLELVAHLETVLDIISIDFKPEKVENLAMGMLALQLGRYRKPLEEHLAYRLNPDRSARGILFLAGLYHDSGKLATQAIDPDERTRFIGHELASSGIVKERSAELRLSNDEIERLVTIVRNHMRPSLLSHSVEPPSRKAVYRFFRDTREAGVDICLVSLADVLATYGPTLPQERWARHLEVIRSLLRAWYEEKDERLFPPAMITGNELMQALGLSTGPVVGYLLDAIREGQVSQEINDKDEALELAARLLKDYKETGLPR